MGRVILAGLVALIGGMAADQSAAAGQHHEPAVRLPLVLRYIRSCESTGPPRSATRANYRAQNARSSASGAFQVLDTTWDGFDGYSKARFAPRIVQDRFALRLFHEQGTSPWQQSAGCWR